MRRAGKQHLRLPEGYAAFHNRFGPDTLSSLDDEALLQDMHTQGIEPRGTMFDATNLRKD
jgi:hypothetical protein